jgi:DNA modification methylase
MDYELKTLRLVDLKPHPKNPRVHPDKLINKLVSSITEFGFTTPVLVDGDNRILAGHARCKAAEKMGLETVPAIVLPLTGAAADAYVIVDNKLNELSEWDETILAELLTDIDSAGFDVEFTGFDADEIDALLTPKGAVEDNFDREKAMKDIEQRGTVTQRGDIWLLDGHRLLCGDSSDAADFETLMNGQKAQLCVTSPPYGVGLEYEQYGLEPWMKLMEPVVKNICKYAGTAVVNLGDLLITKSQFIEPTNLYLMEMFRGSGFRPLWVRVWDKIRQPLSTKAPYHLATNKPVASSELITAYGSEETDAPVEESDYSFVSAFAGYSYKFAKRLTKQERREWGVSPIWRMLPTDDHKKDGHPAAFPVELPWRCIKMHSDKGGIVLEPFSGSGTTIIACRQSERVCYAMEYEPKYVDLSVKRYIAFAESAEGVQLIRNGEPMPFDLGD